jgi:cytochrome c553
MTQTLSRLFAGLVVCHALAQSPVRITAEQTDFFEKKIRPVFVQNCQMCHNSKARMSGIDLSTGAGLPVDRLLRAVGYEDSIKMPPAGKLKPEELRDLADWVKIGAPWPNAQQATPQAVAWPALGAYFTDEQKKFWAFQPVKPPAAKDLSIDSFIQAKLQEKGLQPAPRADKLTLLRRATFDLTGLPPTRAEIDAFLADQSPQAYEKVIDRLLASPRYGERWGRHWLDVARYADSTGNDEDHRYPYAWRYRDYVIDAFNRDLRYNQFVQEQIAGDLLPGAGRRGIVATGFLALGAKAIAQQDKKKMIYDVYDEQVDVVSKAFLGLTMACARCHNHKFDPIYTKDYYSMVAMFANTRDFVDREAHVSRLLYVPLVPKDQYAKYEAEQARITAVKLQMEDAADQDLERYIHTQSVHVAQYMLACRGGSSAGLEPALLTKWAAYLQEGSKAHAQLAGWDRATPQTQAAVAESYQQRFTTQLAVWEKTVAAWRIKINDMPPPPKPEFDAVKDPFFYEVLFDRGPFDINEKDREKLLSPATQQKVAALKKQVEGLKAHAMPEPDMADAVEEGPPVEQKVFLRGDYNNPGDDAPKAFPTILAKPQDEAIHTTSGRLELAGWLTNPENPLPARVLVNRLWQWHFGEGIVRTPDNFGKMGDRPSHPELLDYLATKFIAGGWSIKAMNRMIMLSSVYQSASDADEKTLEADPENRLLAHFNRQRLDVEEIRDGLLAIGGTLDLTMGGTLQKGFGTDDENGAGRLSLDPTKLTRRTVYLPLRRANLPTLLNLFDFGDATTVNGKRTQTNVAPQTLFMMNSEFGFEHAHRVAEDLLAMKDAPDKRRLEEAYLRILNRKPEPDEIDAALTYISQFEKKYPGPELNAWQSFVHLLMASNEFVYLD